MTSPSTDVLRSVGGTETAARRRCSMDVDLLTSPSELEIALRYMAAIVLGGAIGFEREMREHPAGLKTHMLTALASAVFTTITFEIFRATREIDPASSADPVRLIEAVTAGVAFLAAGTIIQSRGEVKGLTTGAGVWMAGAVGVACGAGYLILGVISAGLAVAIFLGVNAAERHLLGTRGPGSEDNEPPAAGTT